MMKKLLQFFFSIILIVFIIGVFIRYVLPVLLVLLLVFIIVFAASPKFRQHVMDEDEKEDDKPEVITGVIINDPVYGYRSEPVQEPQEPQEPRYAITPLSAEEIDSGVDMISAEYTQYEVDPVRARTIHDMSMNGDDDLAQFLNLLSNMRTTADDMLAIESGQNTTNEVDELMATSRLYDLQRQWTKLKMRIN